MLRKLGVRSQVSGLRPLILSALSGILLSLSFSSFNLWIFAWFGFLPLFFALENKPAAKRFCLAFLSGVFFWSCTVYWLIHVTLPGTVILILYLALYFAFFGLVFPYLLSTNYQLLSLPSAWVLLEYIRSYLFTGFPWALLGYSQYRNLPVIQLADLAGAWGVSFLVMMVNVGVYSVIGLRLAVSGCSRSVSGYRFSGSGGNKKYLFALLSLALVLAYGYLNLYRKPQTAHRKPLKVTVIQGNIPQELKWRSDTEGAILEKYLAMSEIAVLKDRPDLVVWPEAAFPGLFGEDILLGEKMLEFSKKQDLPLLAGAVVRDKNKYFNSALLLERGKLSGRYDKLHLVPFGEYVPLKNLFPFLAAIVPIGDIEAGKEYSVFQLSAVSDQLSAFSFQQSDEKINLSAKFSVLICFEDLFPELSRAFVNKGADFLVNITNDAWYKKTSAAYQHLAASVFRAVENRVFLVRAANTGISGFISPSGKIIAAISDPESAKEIFVDGFSSVSFSPQAPQPTVYSRLGDYFIGICLAVVLCGIIAALIRGKK